MSENDSASAGETEVKASGTTFEELLASACEELYATAIDLETVREKQEESFSIPWEGTNEDIFRDFLLECLRMLQEEKFIAKYCEVDIDSDEIFVTMRGEHFVPGKHTVLTEIKGLGTEALSVTEDANGAFEGEFTLDV